jgi:serine/threonine protein kinase
MHVPDHGATSAYAIVTELMNMDLASYLAQNRVPSLDVQVKIASDIADGLMYLHHTMRGLMDHSIWHCDIKPANILCNVTAGGDVRAKIGDYGIAAVIDQENQTVPFRGGTQAFLDPCIFRDGWAKNSSAVKTLDIYAYGLLLMCLLAGVPAPPSEWVDPMSALRDYIEHTDDPRSVGLYRIAWKCVIHAPADRPTAEDLVAELQVLQRYSDQSNASRA